MATAKQQIATPIGELRWVFITGEGRPNLSGINQYEATLVLSGQDADNMIAQIEAFWEANKPKNAKAPMSLGYKTLEDGSVAFSFKTTARFPNGEKKTIGIYDAKGKKVDNFDKLIGNGSTGRISGVMAVYDNGPNKGVTLYLTAIQLKTFIEYQGAVAFDELQEGGYEYQEEFEVQEAQPVQPVRPQPAQPVQPARPQPVQPQPARLQTAQPVQPAKRRF